MRVLLIGASGFIGKRLCRLLLKLGYEVRALSRRERPDVYACNSSIEWLQLDLLDINCDLNVAVKNCSVIFNCAGELHNEALMEALHVEATARLLTASRRQSEISGCSLHWVQLSSVGAYGPPISPSMERTIAEDSLVAPRGGYEVSKTKADSLIIGSSKPGVMTFSILRPSNVFGAGMPNPSLRQWGDTIKHRCFFYVGAPGAISTYVHVDDVVEALMLCGFESAARNQIFNLSSDCPQEELVDAMASYFKVGRPLLRLPEAFVRFFTSGERWFRRYPLTQARVNSLVGRTHYNCQKLEAVLGYRPRRAVPDYIGEVFKHDELI